jgi:cystathionine beta-lyase
VTDRAVTPILVASFDELRRTHTSIKWRTFDEDVLPVWVAEMDARPCEPVVEAVTAALARGDTGYPVAEPFAHAFAGFAKGRWQWELDPATVGLVPDVMIGVAELLRLATERGGPVIVSPPCYNAFFGFIESIRRRLVEAPLDDAGRLDQGALRAAFASVRGERAAYLLCNPQNPTGVVHTRGELETLAALAREYDVTVVSDEIHAPLLQPGETFTPYVTVTGGETGIAVLSGSKAWNLAALKAAVAVPGAEAGELFGGLHEVNSFGASHLGVVAQTAAFTDGEAWLDQVIAEIGANARLLESLLAEAIPEIVYRPAASTYFGWLDCRRLGLGDDPAATFLARGRVAFSSGPEYHGAGFVRFNLATSPANVTEAVRRMASAI